MIKFENKENIKVGDRVKVFDPDVRKVREGTVIRIALNGLRIHQDGYGEVAAKTRINGVWANEEDIKYLK